MDNLLDSRDAASDKILRNLRIIVFPRWAVYFVVSVLFTFTLANFLSKAWIFLSVKRWRTERATQSSEKEAGPGFRGARTQHTVSLRRLPLAILGAIRIISFRVTLHLFDKRYLMSETAVSLGYMFTMLMFTFCGCKHIIHLKSLVKWWHEVHIQSYSSELWQWYWSSVLCRSCRCDCNQPTHLCYRPCWKK